jgi:hypothetical protein
LLAVGEKLDETVVVLTIFGGFPNIPPTHPFAEFAHLSENVSCFDTLRDGPELLLIHAPGINRLEFPTGVLVTPLVGVLLPVMSP